MLNKCGIVNCRGNYDALSKCRVIKLPSVDPERQMRLAKIPPRKHFDIANAKSFFVCEKHWPPNASMKKLPGGTTRPAVAPNIFDVPASCLPTPQPPPRPAKQVDKELEIFMARDRINSFTNFVPDKKFARTTTMLLLQEHPTDVLFFSCRPTFTNAKSLNLWKTNQHFVLPLCVLHTRVEFAYH